jgi:type IV pilus assembly protein PilO
MQNLPELRRRLRIITAVLGGLALVLATLLILMYSNASVRAATFQSLHKQVQNRRSAMVSPQTVQDRVKQAREQIAHFYEGRFPDGSASVFEELGTLAKENKVQLNTASYKATTEASPIDGITPMDVSAALDGDYAQAMKFINALERDKMFFIVDGINLGDSQSVGSVRLAIHLQTFMKDGAQ